MVEPYLTFVFFRYINSINDPFKPHYWNFIFFTKKELCHHDHGFDANL